jgi:WD40-like Beta Propeller Repeat
VLHIRGEQQAAAANAPAPASAVELAAVTRVPHLVFRNTALGAHYGDLALVPLTAPDGPRAVVTQSCDRVYARAGSTFCLRADRGLVTTYQAVILGADWQPTVQQPLAGLPSRARISPDGSLVASTTFVFGDSYTNPGQFSTRTLISRRDGSLVADLEQYVVHDGDRTISAADKNLWGVTFADDDRFYVTVASGGHTWLAAGSITARSLTTVRSDVECPSLSPDGTRIAFKKHGNLAPGRWRLAVYDLRTGAETLLAEARSVDDQVDWLDNTHVMYGLPRITSGAATSDIWSVPADGTGAPRVLVHDAWSPAVVR